MAVRKKAVSSKKGDARIKAFADKKALETWLEKNHDRSDGFWLRIAKKGSGKKSVTYPEAVEAALCFGWIDGQKKPFDETAWLQKLTPRRKRSLWSQINRDKATALIADGAMRRPGLAEIERAKADGRWDTAYASQRTITVPEDLTVALAKNPAAAANFEKVSSANRYAVLWHIHNAKKPETRAGRIEKFVRMLEKGHTLH